MATISGKQLAEAMTGIPKWQRKGRVIHRTYEFKGLPEAIKFVNAVAEAAEKAWHHPDIDIRSNKVTLALTTHDEGGLTGKDFALAAKADSLEWKGNGKKQNVKRKT